MCFCERDAQSVLVKGAILQSLGCMLRSSHLESQPGLCSSHPGCMHHRNLPEIHCCENTSCPPPPPPQMKYRPQWTQNVLRKGSRGITPTAPFLPTAAWCSPKWIPSYREGRWKPAGWFQTHKINTPFYVILLLRDTFLSRAFPLV